MPAHRRQARRNSGTGDQTPAAPSTAAPSARNKTPGAALRAEASRAESMADRSRNRAPQTRPTAFPMPRHNRSDRSQRMVGANSLLQTDIGEQLSRALVRASHSILSTTSTPSESCLCPPRHRLFQRPARGACQTGSRERSRSRSPSRSHPPASRRREPRRSQDRSRAFAVRTAALIPPANRR
jgi:hypothetical protein